MDSSLQFRNGTFRILQLGDLHVPLHIDTRERRKKLEDTHNLIKMGILALKPDLVVLIGDNVSMYDGSVCTDEEYRAGLERAIAPVLEAGLPFAFVLGNHEHDCGNEEQVLRVYDAMDACVVHNDPDAPAGGFNSHLLLKDSAGKEDIFNLWFLESNNRFAQPEISYYDTVHGDQISWYERTEKAIREAHGRQIPSVVFQHIPVIQEYRLLREATLAERPVAVQGHSKFAGKYYVPGDGMEGTLGESPASPDFDGGQFDAWRKAGDVTAAFFGHDHMNGFTGTVDGILLAQCRTAGFFVYTDGCRSAVRLITLHENDLRHPETKLYFFKELGLISQSLGPIQKVITDRQSINLHKYAPVAAAAVGAAVVGSLVRKHKK